MLWVRRNITGPFASHDDDPSCIHPANSPKFKERAWPASWTAGRRINRTPDLASASRPLLDVATHFPPTFNHVGAKATHPLKFEKCCNRMLKSYRLPTLCRSTA